MIMDMKCPHCGEWLDYDCTPEYIWLEDDMLDVRWHPKCHRCHEDCCVSEELKIIARFVAKDHDELERLWDEDDRRE